MAKFILIDKYLTIVIHCVLKLLRIFTVFYLHITLGIFESIMNEW
jgi:hypothetical protein